METLGLFAPETPAAVRERYEALGPAAQVVTREVATAMEFDAAEYRDRVTRNVVETARDALFASLLEVQVGSAADLEAAIEAHPAYAVHRQGHPDVDRAVWHVAPAAESLVAATFQDERDAAVATLRRQAFGAVYRELL